MLFNFFSLATSSWLSFPEPLSLLQDARLTPMKMAIDAIANILNIFIRVEFVLLLSFQKKTIINKGVETLTYYSTEALEIACSE
jgi:hypothetical protein